MKIDMPYIGFYQEENYKIYRRKLFESRESFYIRVNTICKKEYDYYMIGWNDYKFSEIKCNYWTINYKKYSEDLEKYIYQLKNIIEKKKKGD